MLSHLIQTNGGTPRRLLNPFADPTRLRKGLITFPFVALRFVGSCFTQGAKAVIDGRYNGRQAAYIIAGTVPALLGVAMITVPTILFPTPSHQAFYHFAGILQDDSVSLIPMALGAISTTVGLKVPIG